VPSLEFSKETSPDPLTLNRNTYTSYRAYMAQNATLNNDLVKLTTDIEYPMLYQIAIY
jgi:hypothetical protein